MKIDISLTVFVPRQITGPVRGRIDETAQPGDVTLEQKVERWFATDHLDYAMKLLNANLPEGWRAEVGKAVAKI